MQRLNNQQIYHLKKHNDISTLPNNSGTLVHRDNMDIIIIDIIKFSNGITTCQKTELLDFVEDFEKCGWKFYFASVPYYYFYKKRNKFVQIFSKLVNKL